MTNFHAFWHRLKLPIFVLPAAGVTLFSLYLLLSTLTSSVAASEPGDVLYTWRDTALTVQQALTIGAEKQSGLALPARETAVSAPASQSSDTVAGDMAQGDGENGR